MKQPDLFGYTAPAPDPPADPALKLPPSLPQFNGPITHETIMTFGRYQGKQLQEVPYDYLLDLYIWNRSGDLLEYIESVIDQAKGNYNNLTHHKPADYVHEH